MNIQEGLDITFNFKQSAGSAKMFKDLVKDATDSIRAIQQSGAMVTKFNADQVRGLSELKKKEEELAAVTKRANQWYLDMMKNAKNLSLDEIKAVEELRGKTETLILSQAKRLDIARALIETEAKKANRAVINDLENRIRIEKEMAQQVRRAEVEERKRERMIRKVIGGVRELVDAGSQLARGIAYLTAANEKDFEVMAQRIVQFEGYANAILGTVNSIFQLAQLYGDSRKLLTMLTAAKVADTAATTANTAANIANAASQAAGGVGGAKGAGGLLKTIGGLGGAAGRLGGRILSGGRGAMLARVGAGGVAGAAGTVGAGALAGYGGFKVGEAIRPYVYGAFGDWSEYESNESMRASGDKVARMEKARAQAQAQRAGQAYQYLQQNQYYAENKGRSENLDYDLGYTRAGMMGRRSAAATGDEDRIRRSEIGRQHAYASNVAANDVPTDSSGAAKEASLERQADAVRKSHQLLEQLGQLDNQIREKEIKNKEDLIRKTEQQREAQERMVESIQNKIHSAEERFAESSRGEQNRAIRAAQKLQSGEQLSRRELKALSPYADTMGGNLRDRMQDMNRQEMIRRGGGILVSDARRELATEQQKLMKIEGDIQTNSQVVVQLKLMDEESDKKFRESMDNATEEMIDKIKELMAQLDDVQKFRKAQEAIVAQQQHLNSQAQGL